jgi:predicted double-glycine peptidase
MPEILQSLAIVLLSLAGAWVGLWFARRRSAWWLVGFLLPLVVILMIGLPRRHYPLMFVPPFKWLVAGRIEFALIGPLAAMLMATPIARLQNVRLRWGAGCFVAVFIVQAAVMPFLMPLIQRPLMAGLVTHIDRNGVCRQSTNYTCGPAAAVTALRAVGIDATEADLAVAAHTNRATGTEPDVLAAVLADRYASQGLHVEYRPFAHCGDLPRGRPVIALINYQFVVDHYVTILDVTDSTVLVGDPVSGRTRVSHADFERDWRGVGIVLSRGVFTKR